MTLAGSWSVVSDAHIQTFTFFTSAYSLKITVGCLTSTYPSICTKTCTRVGLIGPHCKIKVAVGTSTRADACAFTSDLRLSSNRRRFQMGEIVRNLHTRVRCKNDTKQTRFSVCHCLGARDWWSGRGNTKFEELFDTRRDGHSAELAGATTNSDGKRRAIGV